MSDSITSPPTNGATDSLETHLSRRKTRENTRVIADMVHTRLRDGILSAELRPGRRLVEDELAEWLNVSRTPVREALLRLEQEGLVERDRGWVVREYNPAETRARLECRLAIEGYAARLAATRRSEAQLQELHALADAMEQAGLARREFNRLNDRFHKVIIEAAANAALANLHAQTKMNYWDLSVPVIFTPDLDREIHADHRTLIEALASGDGDKAEALARLHVQRTIEVVLSALGLREPPFAP